MGAEQFGAEPLLHHNENSVDYGINTKAIPLSDSQSMIKSDKIIEILQKHQLDLIIDKDDDIDEDDALPRLFNKYKFTEKKMRDEICKAYQQNDYDLQLTIYLILCNELDMGYNSRQVVYDIILHEYFQLIHFNVDNMIHITTTIIQQLKLDHIIDIESFCDIIRKKGLNGAKIDDFSDSSSFANEFQDLDVSHSALGKVFNLLKEWKPRDHSSTFGKVSDELDEEEKSEQDEEEDDDSETEDSDDEKDFAIDQKEEIKDQENDDEEDSEKFEIRHCRYSERDSKDPLPKHLYKSVKNHSVHILYIDKIYIIISFIHSDIFTIRRRNTRDFD